MKRVSAGVLLFNPTHTKILLGSVTRQGKWDIPKGGVDDGETMLDAAIRECLEETSIKLLDPENLIDLGTYPYLRDKDLYLFAGCIDEVSPSILNCTSTFALPNGTILPEFDDFTWASTDFVTLSVRLYQSMFNVMVANKLNALDNLPKISYTIER